MCLLRVFACLLCIYSCLCHSVHASRRLYQCSLQSLSAGRAPHQPKHPPASLMNCQQWKPSIRHCPAAWIFLLNLSAVWNDISEHPESVVFRRNLPPGNLPSGNLPPRNLPPRNLPQTLRTCTSFRGSNPACKMLTTLSSLTASGGRMMRHCCVWRYLYEV